MLPDTENLDSLISDLEDDQQDRTKTFYLDMKNNTIGGKVDELIALKQSVYLKLSTEADQYIIYPYTYGLQTLDLIGKPSYYIVAVLPERIKETLLTDDRILEVSKFEFDITHDKIHVRFCINSIYGEIKEETVVIY